MCGNNNNNNNNNTVVRFELLRRLNPNKVVASRYCCGSLIFLDCRLCIAACHLKNYFPSFYQRLQRVLCKLRCSGKLYSTVVRCAETKILYNTWLSSLLEPAEPV